MSAKHTCFVVFGALLLTSLSIGQPPSSDSASSVEELRKQVQQLKEENQRLRALLTEAGLSQTGSEEQKPPASPQTGATSRNALPSYAAPVQKSGGHQSTPTHWLTFPSNERHNRSCLWYRSGRGRPCRADEGIPCKICGG